VLDAKGISFRCKLGVIGVTALNQGILRQIGAKSTMAAHALTVGDKGLALALE